MGEAQTNDTKVLVGIIIILVIIGIIFGFLNIKEASKAASVGITFCQNKNLMYSSFKGEYITCFKEENGIRTPYTYWVNLSYVENQYNCTFNPILR